MSGPMAKISDAVRDLRYLLNRGYPRESAVNFVSNHYCLPLAQRHLLVRCVFSEREAIGHRRKAVEAGAVRGGRLGVDGYNVLITVESTLSNRRVVRCDDGYIRDLRAIFGKYRMSPITPLALTTIVQTIARAKPSYVAVLFDKQVSRSGELAVRTAKQLKLAKLRGDARTRAEVDLNLRAFDVVASSDRVIIKRAKRVWDLPADIAKRRAAKVLDLIKIR